MSIIFQNIKPENFRAWNEGMLNKYDPDAFHHHPNVFVRFNEKKRVKTIFRMMNSKGNDYTIEIGCGAGNVIEEAPNGKLFGMDISPSVLLKARQRLSREVHLFQADAQSLPLKSQVFMQVICSEVLEHLLDPSAALNEIARVLKAKGVAVISVPNETMINRLKSILVKLGIFKWLFQRKGAYSQMPERMENEWHLHTFTLKEWLDLFKKLFRVTQVKKIPFPWIPLRYVVRLERIR
jgi:ubiquinone/menaquinone biosynthesis C-methylase UbiE